MVACGDDDGGGARPPDAGPSGAADAAAPDAAPGSTRWYVFDAVAVPRTADEATSQALDLDGDGEVDNALGGLFAAIDGQGAYSLGLRTASAVETGRLIELASVATAIAEIGLRRGDDLDGDPDDNFSGSETFEVVPVDGADGYLYGTVDGAVLTAGPGHSPVQIAFDRDVPVFTFSPLTLRVRCRVGAGGLTEGVVGFAMSPDSFTDELLPLMAAGLNATVDRQCQFAQQPFCPDGSDGEAILLFFDDDEDGAVSVYELMSNSLISSTYGNPDIDLLDAEGNPSPVGDGVNDSLSFGFGFTAVGAAPPE